MADTPYRKARQRAGRWPAFAAGACGFCITAMMIIAYGATDQAVAQALVNHDSNAPVDVAADNGELQSRADRVVISGNVRIDQAGLSLRAQRVTIAYSDGNRLQLNRIDATGGVTVTKGGDRASGSSAIYDLDRRLITLIGNVELIQGPNRLSGGRMVIDLSSGRASVDGRGTPAGGVSNDDAGGRRVTGRFTVPQRN